MDMQVFRKKLEKAVQELLADKDLMEKFEKNPVQIVEKLIGADLPDDLVNQAIDGIKAKIKLDQVGDALGALGGLFGKK